MSKRTRHTLPKRLPRYAPAVVQLGQDLLATQGPGLHHVTVEHDAWCAIFAGRPGHDRAN